MGRAFEFERDLIKVQRNESSCAGNHIRATKKISNRMCKAFLHG
jgi:hypothetical protein